MNALPAHQRGRAGAQAAAEWAAIAAQAPQKAATMRPYLAQASTFLAPLSVESAGTLLRQFATWLLDNTDVKRVAAVRRDHVEDFRAWLGAKPGYKGK